MQQRETKCREQVGDVNKKILEVSGLITATVFYAKFGQLKNEITYTSDLVTTTVLNTKIGEVGRKIPNVSGIFRRTDYNAKISNIKKKYFMTSDYNKYISEILDAKIKEKGLVDNS